MNSRSGDATQKRLFQTSCERCRKRKIRCDRTQPCSKCQVAKVECIFIGSGEKQRPVPRGYVQALEGQIASLERFITKLVSVDTLTRDEMLANFSKTASNFSPGLEIPTPVSKVHEAAPSAEALPIRNRTGQLRKLKDGASTEYHGATSSLQMNTTKELHQAPLPIQNDSGATESGFFKKNAGEAERHVVGNPSSTFEFEDSIFSPKSEICRRLMGEFFRKQYPFFMYMYREGFILDYDAGEGCYYSDILLYAICSMGALVSEDLKELSDMFFNRAQELLYGFCLESPNLSTLQAVLLMGHREIGRGRASKGWLLSGMAFRLAHEMGLHLDPNNWNEAEDSRVEREILRRTYWAAYVLDKQLSLYFGRPPALHSKESDVISTVRIPYPEWWQPLLNKYVIHGTLAIDWEDGDALVAFFIQQAELSKIVYRIITDVFENRSSRADETVLAAFVQDIQVSLRKWASDLPANVHWNEWSIGQIPSLVLYLHMQYHTALIILHRPPRQRFKDLKIATGENVKICNESLDTIIRLLKLYSRNYRYDCLPVTFVHVLASAASIILMKQHIQNLSWDDPVICKPLDLILGAIDEIAQTWSCASQVREVIQTTRGSVVQDTIQFESPSSFDIMAGLTGDNTYDPMNFDIGLGLENANGYINSDGYFDEVVDWSNVSFH